MTFEQILRGEGVNHPPRRAEPWSREGGQPVPMPASANAPEQDQASSARGGKEARALAAKGWQGKGSDTWSVRK